MKSHKNLSLKEKDFYITPKHCVIIYNTYEKSLDVACTTIALELDDPKRSSMASNLKSAVVSEAVAPVNTQDDQLSGMYVYFVQ